MPSIPVNLLPFFEGQFHVFLIILLRVAGILSVIPAIGTRSVPAQVKIGLVIGLSAILMPVVGAGLGSVTVSPATLVPLIFTEFLVGLVLGLCVRFVFVAFEMAGELLGTQMGINIAGVLDPMADASLPLLGRFFGLLALLVFFAIDGHHILLAALTESFRLVPPLSAHLSGAVMEAVMQLAVGMFMLALKIAAPVMTALFVVTFAMGILGRTIPQFNVLLNNVTVTVAVGLLVLGLSLPMLGGAAQASIGRIGSTLEGLLALLGPGR